MGSSGSTPVKAAAFPRPDADGETSSARSVCASSETGFPSPVCADNSASGSSGIAPATAEASLSAAAEKAATIPAAAEAVPKDSQASSASPDAAASTATSAPPTITVADEAALCAALDPYQPLSSARSCESSDSGYTFNSEAGEGACAVVSSHPERRAAVLSAPRILYPSEVLVNYRHALRDAADRMGLKELNIPHDVLAVLLAHHKWSVDLLVERYFALDDGADAKVQCAAGVAQTVRAHKAGQPPAIRSAAPFSCPICLEDIAAGGGVALACGHDICVTCWAGHLDHVMGTVGKACVFERCPESGCGNAITEGAMRAICAALDDASAAERLASRWESFMLRQFTDVVKTMEACRRPGCPFFLEIPEESVGVVKDVTCPCTESICFSCKGEGHAPATCKEAADWAAKSAEVMNCVEARERQRLLLLRDNEQVRRLRERVRAEEDRRARPEAQKCPKCGVIMEKNKGCQFMMCGAHAHAMAPEAVRAAGRGCGHEFCWTCLQPKAGHIFDKCAAPPRIAPEGTAMSEVERLIFAAILAEDASGPVEAAIAKANKELQRAIARNEIRAPDQQRLVGGRTFWAWERVQHWSVLALMSPEKRMLHLNKARDAHDAALLDGLSALLRGQRFARNLYVQQFYCRPDHPDWQSTGLLASQRMVLEGYCKDLHTALKLPLEASRKSILDLTAAIAKQAKELP